MLGLLDRARYAATRFLVAGIITSCALFPSLSHADEITDAAASLQAIETELESIARRNDSIDQRMAALTVPSTENNSKPDDSLFTWSNPSLWLLWILLVAAIVTLFLLRKGSQIITIGHTTAKSSTDPDKGPSDVHEPYILAEPLKVVKIKVRKISKLKKDHAS